MSYNIHEILTLPVEEQRNIALTILENIGEAEDDDLSEAQRNELDKRIAEIEAGNYKTCSLDEVKAKLAAK